MPCLSSSAVSALNESIRVSNAESQLAVPLMITTFFGASVISSPKGSAVWTGGGGRRRRGVCGGWRRGVGGAATWFAAGGGAGSRRRRRWRARRRRARGRRGGRRRRLRQRAADAQRNRGHRDQRDHGKAERAEAIHSGILHRPSGGRASSACPGHAARSAAIPNTQGRLSSHDRCVMRAPAAHDAALANPPSFAI